MHITGFHKNVYIMYLFIYLKAICPCGKDLETNALYLKISLTSAAAPKKKKTCILTKVGF